VDAGWRHGEFAGYALVEAAGISSQGVRLFKSESAAACGLSSHIDSGNNEAVLSEHLPSDAPRRKNLSDDVAKKLESMIIAGEYAVGAKLPNEKELAQQFGVGRSSMREAVRTLQAAGFLRSSHGIGVFVNSDRPRIGGAVDQSLIGGYTMSDLFEARVAIEGQTAELAARRLTDHHREIIQSVIGSAAKSDVSHAEFVRLDYRFHRQIADASGNPLLLHMWDTLGSQFEEYSTKVIKMPGRLERAHDDHCGIAEAIFAADSLRAGELAREHVLTVQRELSTDRPPTRRGRP